MTSRKSRSVGIAPAVPSSCPHFITWGRRSQVYTGILCILPILFFLASSMFSLCVPYAKLFTVLSSLLSSRCMTIGLPAGGSPMNSRATMRCVLIVVVFGFPVGNFVPSLTLNPLYTPPRFPEFIHRCFMGTLTPDLLLTTFPMFDTSYSGHSGICFHTSITLLLADAPQLYHIGTGCVKWLRNRKWGPLVIAMEAAHGGMSALPRPAAAQWLRCAAAVPHGLLPPPPLLLRWRMRPRRHAYGLGRVCRPRGGAAAPLRCCST